MTNLPLSGAPIETEPRGKIVLIEVRNSIPELRSYKRMVLLSGT